MFNEASGNQTLWQAYNALPPEVKQVADRAFAMMQANPSHPSLRFKQAGNLWSARVGIGHRAIATRDGEECVWVWIGTHAEYDQLLRSR